jgi:hypothetical protein
MNSKFKIVETPDYTLTVSDEEIKPLDWVHDPIRNRAAQIHIVNKKGENFGAKKIIAYQPKNNAPELDLPLLPEVVVEDEVEDIFNKVDDEKIRYSTEEHLEWSAYRLGFFEGYKSATKVYSEEDLRNCFYDAKTPSYEDFGDWVEAFNKNKRPKPEWFIAEREKVYHANRKGVSEFQDANGFYSWKLKTTTINGKTYLVGTYLNLFI